MSDKKILDSLEILGITDSGQFNEGDLSFWWKKKYLEIRYGNLSKEEKTDILIKINNAKDYLSDVSFQDIDSAFKKSKLNDFSSNLENKNNEFLEKVAPNNNNFKDENLVEENNKIDNSISESNSYKKNGINIQDEFDWKKEWKKSGEDVDKIFNNSFVRFLIDTFVIPLVIVFGISLFGSGEWVIWLFLYFALYIYFFPSVIARSRRKNNYWSIWVLNLFFGWTLIGWVASLIWAVSK